jgi:hypothetical protein
MNGTMWPTWIDGAVGSTPTYAPIRRRVSRWSRSSRALDIGQMRPVVDLTMPHEPNNLVNIASFLQKAQHALFLSFFDRLGSLLPIIYSIFDLPDVVSSDPPLLLDWLELS